MTLYAHDLAMSRSDQRISVEPGFEFSRRYSQGMGFYIPQSLLQVDEESSEITHSSQQSAESADVFPENVDSSSEAVNSDATPEILQLPIFDIEKLERAIQQFRDGDSDKSNKILPTLEAAQVNDGYRSALPSKVKIAEIRQGLNALAAEMPNFASAVDTLGAELALALSGPVSEFRVTPIVLYGAPGVGKTRFASKLSAILNTGFEKVSMGSASGSFELSGVSQGWGTTRPGRIAKILAEREDASPVVLLDELDKAGGDYRFPVLPVLLDLLESDSARQFRDECLELDMDASRIIFIATANDPDLIPDPVRSRVRMIEVEVPTTEQRLQIALLIAGWFEARYDLAFELAILEQMAGSAIDLRCLQQVMRQAAGRALVEERAIQGDDFDLPNASKTKMGFL